MSSSLALSPKAEADITLPWYAIVTRYRFEKKVLAQLESCGFETFLPVVKEVHHWSDREKQVEMPLFPGYTFARVQLSTSTRLEILRTAGVIRIIGQGAVATPIPDRQIEDLQRVLGSDLACTLRPFLKVGHRVRVCGGCLDGLEGILAQNDKRDLIISIDCIERSLSIRIEGYQLQWI
jgi:transcription antitermination factor NusG